MRIVARYSFKDGEAYIERHYANELQEVEQIVANVNAAKLEKKTSREKSMPGRSLYSPKAMNAKFKEHFTKKEWHSKRLTCEYSDEYYVDGYRPKRRPQRSHRELDFVKRKLGVEVQFGKYAFMVYDVCAKMPIFRNEGLICAGIEIVPVRSLAPQMSTGLSYFEQFVWDLERRGVAGIDVPVLILGIAP